MQAESKARFGWAMYDWAAQPFFTIIFTFIFGPYFVAHVIGDPNVGTSMWAWVQVLAGILMALTAPFLGALADATGPRKPWVIGFSALCIVCCFLLWFATPAASDLRLAFIVVAVALGVIGAEYSIVFNNAMLPSLAKPDRVGQLSGFGWAMGYIGALVALPIMLWVTGQLPGVPGPALDVEARVADRLAGPFSGLWFIIFMIPFVVWTPDEPRLAHDRVEAMRRGVAELARTVRGLVKRRNTLRFLFARMIYYDGLNAIFAFGGIYAANRFGWTTTELGLFGIMILLAGIPGCYLGGWLDDRLGSKQTLNISIGGLLITTVLILSIGDGRVLFVVPMDFPAPDDGLFASPAEWAMIVFTLIFGLAAGPAQAASRSMVARLAPPAKLGKYFGLFALSGKATSFLVPLIVGPLAFYLGDRIAFGTIPVFLAIGLVLLAPVREERDPD